MQGQDGNKNGRALPAVVGACGLASAVVPALAEALWYSGASFVLWGGVGAVGVCSTVLLLACSHRGMTSN